MAVQEAWRLDRKLTAMMVEDMLFDPILAAKVLLRMRVPPHEELRIMWMWNTYFTNDDSGFSTGKSFTFAVVSALRSILMSERTAGVISKTFSQGKLIFQNFDNWYSSSPIFRSCIKHTRGKSRLVHGNDVWLAEFTNNSLIRVLPPDFLKDAERLRSERWNDGYFDEWTVYGNFSAFNRTLVGRCTKTNDYSECPVRQNHIHLASTPGFTYDPAYQIVKRVHHQQAQGNEDYGRFSCNYRHIPDTKQWKFLVNRKTIFQMQTTLPSGVIGSEIDGRWQRSSGAYYDSFAISNVRHQTNIPLLQRSSELLHIGAFDVARGGSQAQSQSGDDFALSILRFPENDEHAKPIHTLTVRVNNIKAEGMSGIIHKYTQRFGVSAWMYDPGGGGLFVADELAKDMQLIDNVRVPALPMLEMTPFEHGAFGQHLLVPFRRSQIFIDRMEGKMKSDSVLVNKMHHNMKNAIDTQQIILAGKWAQWEKMGYEEWDVDAKREYLNSTAGLNEYDRALAEMDLAVSQLMMVDIEKDKETKTPRLDGYGMYKFLSKFKKDAAYSLIYCYYLYCLMQWRHFKFGHKRGKRSLTAFGSRRI